ncbi:unnamed protein product [Paramecium sonneborni]|uniref:Uncharacterized protein n=1 Tax=Paramecium sonneborni TaxID=65129 RepID=A0A8S1QEI5_9CILI|nr:unnamed protein product [Paramecium sonneborni]
MMMIQIYHVCQKVKIKQLLMKKNVIMVIMIHLIDVINGNQHIRMNKCYQCKQHYLLIEAINICKSICGDLVITQNEQCDDGNDYIFDGCHLCQFQCKDHYSYCNQGICCKCDKQMVGTQKDLNVNLYAEMEKLLKDKNNVMIQNSYPFELCISASKNVQNIYILLKWFQINSEENGQKIHQSITEIQQQISLRCGQWLINMRKFMWKWANSLNFEECNVGRR